MFQNAFQSGGHLEVFDPKINKEKDKNFDKLFKITNPNGVNKTFDKFTKGYIYELEDAMRTKMQFPKNDKQELALVQHFLVFQVFIPVGASFSLEIVVTDTNKNKRRLNFTSSVKTIDKTYFHAKIPIDNIKRGVWLNLSFDLISFFDLFKGQTFRSIDSFVLGAVCKLRKIFTMKNPLAEFSSDDEFSNQFSEAHLVPKSLNYPAGVSYTNQLLNIDTVQKNVSDGLETKEYAGYDESVSKNSTDVSQALKVKGLLSSMKDPKGSNDTNTRFYGKADDRKGLKTQQVLTKATNTLYSEQDKRSPNWKEKEGNNPLQVVGVPKKGNLLASYDLGDGTPVNRSFEENRMKIANSPSRYEDEYEASQSSAVKIRNSSEQPTPQRKAFGKDSNRNLSPQRRGQTNFDEEAKSTKMSDRKASEASSAMKSRAKLEATRTQSDKNLEKRSGVRDTSKGRYDDQDDRSPESQRIYSAAKKFMNDTKTSQSDNSWGVTGQKIMKASASKLTSPKANMQSPRVVMKGGKVENQKSSPQVASLPPKQKNKAKAPTNQKESSKYPKEFEKTGFSDSSDRFNTTGKSFNQRYEAGGKTEIDLFGPFQAVDEIESIEENLEYEMASNTSGMNGSRGFGDYREAQWEEPKNLVKASDNTLKTPQRTLPMKPKYTPSPNKQTINGKKLTDQNQGLNDQQRVTNIDAVLQNRGDYSANKHGIASASERNMMKSTQEEINQINTFENRVNHMASSLRPYSPPYTVAQDNNRDSTIVNKNNEGNIDTFDPSKPKILEGGKDNKMLEVVYDSTWNCYYHPETNTYYEMKE